MISVLATGVMGFISALVLTEVIRRVALTRGVLDIPTSRSAHTVPQPRGGGAAVVTAVPLASAVALMAGASVDRRYWYCVGLATLVALVGLVDDVRALDYRPRLVAQIAAAAALIMLVGPSETIVIPGFVTPLRIVLPEPLAMALTLVAIVGFTNAFNFMDGIDGLAATVAALGGLFIGAMQMPASALVAVATTGATIGFLAHNLPPARIFLGDVGSQYLGFLLAALAVAGERVEGIPASLIALVFLPFAVDTTVTLVRRLRRGERWHQPHQDHIYQRLVADGWSHAQTTALYAVLTAVSGVVLLMVTQWPLFGWIWSLVALSTIAVLLTPPRMWRRVMLRR